MLLQVGTTENKNVDRVVEACRALTVTLWILGRLSDEQERILDNSGLDYNEWERHPGNASGATPRFVGWKLSTSSGSSRR